LIAYAGGLSRTSSWGTVSWWLIHYLLLLCDVSVVDNIANFVSINTVGGCAYLNAGCLQLTCYLRREKALLGNLMVVLFILVVVAVCKMFFAFGKSVAKHVS
jgi:CDP-diglyceride synthetase